MGCLSTGDELIVRLSSKGRAFIRQHWSDLHG